MPESNETKPICWPDEVRMTALLAPFRPYSLNPTAYNAKLDFWADMISKVCYNNQALIVSKDWLKTELQWNGKSPACLEDVLVELKNKGLLVDVNTFMTAQPETWTRWAVNLLIEKPVFWAFNKLKTSVWAAPDPSSLVHIPTVKAISEELLKNIPSSLKGKVVEANDICANYLQGNSQNTNVILHYLRMNKQIAVIEKDTQMLVKFKKDHESKVALSELEVNVYRLEETEKVLSTNIEELEKDAADALKQAKHYIKLNMKPLAKSSLRKKNEINKYIEKRTNALDNLRQLISQIHETESNTKILECYRLGVETARSVLEVSGLTEDNVYDVMDQVESVLDINNEIKATLARPLDPTASEELEQELNAILAHDDNDNNDDDTTTSPRTRDLEERLKKLGVAGLPTPPLADSIEAVADTSTS